MRYRCPVCGYDSGLLYPMCEEEWNQPCSLCGNVKLEYWHFGYPYGVGHDEWVKKDGTVVEVIPLWYEVN